jgi:hypothetical protein
MPASLQSLRTLNIVAAAFHTCLLVGFGSLFAQRLTPANESIDLYRLALDTTGWTPPTVDSDASEINVKQKAVKDGKVNIRQLVMAFFGITALAHALYATDFFGAGWYSSAIARGWNPFRWVEYGLSASIMAALIAPFSGLRSSSGVALVMASTAAMQGTGFLVERALIAPQPDYTAALASTLIGWLLLVTSWRAILGSFFRQLKDFDDAKIKDSNGDPITIPDFVWNIGIVQAAFFSCFGLVQLAEISGMSKKGAAFNYAGTETAYLALSLAAKASLASVIAYGLVARNEI